MQNQLQSVPLQTASGVRGDMIDSSSKSVGLPSCIGCRGSAAMVLMSPDCMQVGKRPILPGAAMFEACAAAAATLQDESRSGSRAALQGTSITAPLQLQQQGPAAAAVLLECSLDAATGRVELATVTPAVKRQQEQRSVHCRGHVAMVQAIAAVSHTTAGRQPAAVLAAVLRMQTPPQPSTSIAATLTIAASGASGYFLHPAAADATLHLSAVTDATAATTLSPIAKPVTRVPTGLGCLMVPQAPASETMHPVASPEASWQQPRSDGSLRCSFRLAEPVLSAATAFQLCDLLIKEMPAAGPQPTASAGMQQQQGQDTPAAAGAADVLYEIQWQAANAGSLTEPISSPAVQQLSWRRAKFLMPVSQASDWSQLSAPAKLVVKFDAHNCNSPAAAAQATLRGLELLQRTAAQHPASSSLQLALRGAFQPLPAAGRQQDGAAAAAGAAVAALAKVAANEYPTAGITTVDTAPSSAPPLMSNNAKVLAEVYGVVLAGCCEVSRVQSLNDPKPFVIRVALQRCSRHCLTLTHGNQTEQRADCCNECRALAHSARRRPAARGTWRACCGPHPPLPSSWAAAACCPAPAARWQTSNSSPWTSRTLGPAK